MRQLCECAVLPQTVLSKRMLRGARRWSALSALSRPSFSKADARQCCLLATNRSYAAGVDER